ncbi:MAG: FtsH protease activity modulator HflK [Rhodospirillaceae bacterium]|nr:FtsH protease activity modulator HflK [Rhodospirillaceae bacterium]
MPWKDNSNSGGPWGGPGGSGGNKPRGPWGGNNGPGGRGNGPFGNPPKFDDLFRKGSDRMKGMLPGGLGSPRGIILIVLAAIVIWLLTGIYRVNPNEAGVETVFGRLTNVTTQGIHWNWPSPIGNVEKPNVTDVRQTTVGLSPNAFRGSRAGSIENESLMLTGDENIIDVQATILWRIDVRTRKVTENGVEREVTDGIRKFVFNIRQPSQTVKDAAEASLREIVGQREFETIRTSGRAEVQEAVRVHIQQLLDEYGAGIYVQAVNLQKVDPPEKVIGAFRDVQAARANREQRINEAQLYRNREVQQAEGLAERITREAEAYKAERIAAAEGESKRFLSVFEQYKAAKDITRQRIYLETMGSLLRTMDKVLIDGNAAKAVPYLPLDSVRPPVAPPKTDDKRPGAQ